MCHGHYKTKMIDLSNSTDLKAAAPVPSTLLKAKFKELKGALSGDDLAECAKAAILPVQEVNIWMEHLKTVAANRQRGAAKAAATCMSRKSKSQAHSTCSEEAWFCGTCGQQYAWAILTFGLADGSVVSVRNCMTHLPQELTLVYSANPSRHALS